MVKKKADALISRVTGGLITTVPTSMQEAKKTLLKMLEWARKKAGEMLSKVTGGVITKIPMSMSDAAQMLSSLIELVKKKVAEMLSKAGGAMGKLGAAMKKMKALDLSKLILRPVRLG